MKTLRGIMMGLIVGIPVGLWLGFNAGRDAPLTTNPFEEYGIAERIQGDAETLYKEIKKDIRE